MNITILEQIHDATQFVTVYRETDDELVPVATAQRRRVYESGPAWRIYDTDGQLMGRVWSMRHRDYGWLHQRVVSIVMADLASRD